MEGQADEKMIENDGQNLYLVRTSVRFRATMRHFRVTYVERHRIKFNGTVVPAPVAFGLELGKFQAGRPRSRFEMFGKGLNNFIEFDSRQYTWATLHNAAQKPSYNTLCDELCEVKNPSHVTVFP